MVNIETIDTEDATYAEVIRLFESRGVWALPVILIDGKAVSWGETEPERIEAAMDEALKPA